MTQSLSPWDPPLVTVVLATLAIGLPIVFALAIRFLWDRNLNLGRSKELEKLIWQLHRIASAMEYQMRLSFPTVQPGTEESQDLAYLQQLAPRAKPASPAVATPNPAPAPVPAATQPIIPPPPETEQPAPLPALQPPTGEVTRHGVNSMFGL